MGGQNEPCKKYCASDECTAHHDGDHPCDNDHKKCCAEFFNRNFAKRGVCVDGAWHLGVHCDEQEIAARCRAVPCAFCATIDCWRSDRRNIVGRLWRFYRMAILFANGCSLYIVLSQLLVAFAEELFFRGYLLEMMKDVARTSERAVIISAFLFGLWHYPISHNIGLVIITFFLGAIYGTLRTLFEKTEKEIGIVSLSIAHWLFNVVL